MKSLIKQFGATDKEAEVYLDLLGLGPQPISVIAKRINTPRSTMYLIIEKLKKLSLLKKSTKFGITYVQAISPSELSDLINKKENLLNNLRNTYQKSLPQLEELERKLSITPSVRFFEGRESIMLMYEQILKQKNFSAFFNPQKVFQWMPEYHYKVPETLKKLNGSARELLVDGPEAKKYKNKYHSKKHQIKILSKKINFDSDTVICKDRLYMAAYGEEQIAAIEIFSPSLSKTQQIIFDQLWASK